MKNKKKHRGVKAEVRAHKKRVSHIATAITIIIIIVVLTISSFLIYAYLNPKSKQTQSYARAAIIDHLSLTAPNKTFIQTATNILEKAGYTVDYYKGEEVTVEFYKNLPTHDYGLIIFRVHSALRDPLGRPLVLFTSQRYSNTKYTWEQIYDRVVPVAYSPEEAKKGILYFGIAPKFVQHDIKGRFQNTTIIMMGCNGLTYTEMAEALIEKGAKAYISWSESVSVRHTDRATAQLLKHLITEKQTIKNAISETMKEVGPDPGYNSTLLCYPP